MALQTLDLWTLVRKRPWIDSGDLAEAIRTEVISLSDNYRCRLLVRDSLEALRGYWGEARYQRWLVDIPERDLLRDVSQEQFDEIGYPSLMGRLMEKTKPDDVTRFFIELGGAVHQDYRIDVAGAVALILSGYLDRYTEDVDIVGEIPAEIRENHRLLDELQASFGLHLGHVQTHYLPTGWRERSHSLGKFGGLNVFFVDVYDVFLSKMFSARRKDKDDLRMLEAQLDRGKATRRLQETAGPLLAEPQLLQHATANWRLLFGEDLPS